MCNAIDEALSTYALTSLHEVGGTPSRRAFHIYLLPVGDLKPTAAKGLRWLAFGVFWWLRGLEALVA